MSPGARKQRGRLRRALILLAVGLAAAVALLEGAVHLRQTWKYGTTAGYYAMENDPASGLRVPIAGQTVGPIHVNSRGFRGPELEEPRPPGRIRLAFLGGSTTFCAHASSDEAAWPSLVARGLAEAHPELTFDYVNGGVAGYSTTQSRRNLRHRIAPLAPDVVFVYHGTNDVTQDSRAIAVQRGVFDRGGEEASWLGKKLLFWGLVEKNIRYLARKAAAGDDAAKIDVDPAELAGRFRQRLADLVREAGEVAPLAVVVTFAHRQRRGQPPDELRDASGSSLYYMPYLTPDSILSCFEAYNRVLRGVARDLGALLIEGELSIPGDADHFVDSVHFTDAGNRKQAERILAGLEQSEAFQALLAERRRAARDG